MAVSSAVSSLFRTCPDTGLPVHLPAQNLIKANAVFAVVFLLVGGIQGLMVALTRWPAVQLLPDDWFYLVLTGHGLNVLAILDHLLRGRGSLFRFRHFAEDAVLRHRSWDGSPSD